jgi:hypothetical protein
MVDRAEALGVSLEKLPLNLGNAICAATSSMTAVKGRLVAHPHEGPYYHDSIYA